MKKLVLMMVSLFLISGSAFAQDKEALKAEKEAMKEAEKMVKKATTIYETSIPNQQYGRKETDFTKLAEALPIIQAATENQYSKNLALTWKTAANIELEYYKKLENEIKADPDNEQLRKSFFDSSAKLLTYCIKYDSLLVLDPKVKPEEVKKEHTFYQQISVNPAAQLLQVSQNYSYSEKQDELKLGAKYSEELLYAIEKSHLLSDFSNPNINLEEWKTYAKAFRAQSYYHNGIHLEGISEDKIVAAYENLMTTTQKGFAYQQLSNYYKDKDDTKRTKYLQEGIDALKGDAGQKELRAQFAFILMQNLYDKKDREGFKKIAQLIKEEFADNDNTIGVYQREGQMAFEDKQYDDAIAIFLAAKEKYPDESECLLMAARSAWQKAIVSGSKKADMDAAIELYKRLESENPDDPDLWGDSLYILYYNTQQGALAAPYKKYHKEN